MRDNGIFCFGIGLTLREGNKYEQIEIFEQKIKDKIDEVWGE